MRVNREVSVSNTPQTQTPSASDRTASKATGAALSVLQQGAQISETQMSSPESAVLKGRGKDLTGTDQSLTSIVQKKAL